MQRISLLLVLALSTLATAADYLVVVSKATYAKPGWKQVADGLVKKHTGALVQYDKSVKETLPALRKHRPRFVAFVCLPETISKDEPKLMFQVTRAIDGDPFGDAQWGIVTGMDAAGAMKIVKTTKPLIIRRSLNTTGVNKSLFDEAVVISDGRTGAIEVKRDGKTKTTVYKTPDGKKADPANLFRFVKFFNEMEIDLMVTSSHACQVNLSMPFTHALLCSNITKGRLVTGMMAKMKGNSEMEVSKDGKRLEVKPRENPMVFFPVGNCLVGDCKYTSKSLIPTMISNYGVRQAAGYTVPTWYGKMGWGAWGKWQGSAGQLSLSQALFLRNQEMIVDIIEMQAKGVKPPRSRADFNGDRKKLYGHIHDLNVVPLYGDPAWVAKFDAAKTPGKAVTTTYTKKDDVYTLTIKGKDLSKLIKGGYSAVLPIRLPRAVGTKDIEIIEGKQFAPLVADDFILLRKGGHTGNETKIVFKLLPKAKLAPKPEPKAKPAPVSVAGKMPLETLKAFMAAMEKGDVEAVLCCHKTVSNNEEEMIRLMVPGNKLMIEYTRKFYKAYPGKSISGFRGRRYVAMIDNVEKAEIKIDGDKATAKIPGGMQTLHLAKFDGVWKMVNPQAKALPDERVAFYKMMAKVMNPVLEKVMGEIGKEDVTAEDIKKMLHDEQRKAMAQIKAQAEAKPKAKPAPKAAEPKPAPAGKMKKLDDATLQLAATDWFEAIFSGKADAALKLSQAPFQMDRKKVLYTMEELKAFYKEIAENQRGEKLPLYEAKVLAVVPEKLAKLPCLAGTKAVKITMEDGDEVMYVFVDPATGKVCGFSD